MRYRMNETSEIRASWMDQIPVDAPPLTKEFWPVLEEQIQDFAKLYADLTANAVQGLEALVKKHLEGTDPNLMSSDAVLDAILKLINEDIALVESYVQEQDQELEAQQTPLEEQPPQPTTNNVSAVVQEVLESKYSPMVEIPQAMYNDLASLEILTLPEGSGKGTAQGELKQTLKLFELVGFPNYSPDTLKMVGEQLFSGDPTLVNTIIKAVTEVMCKTIRSSDIERMLGKQASLKYIAFCRLSVAERKEELSKANLSLANLLGVSQDEIGLLISNNYGKNLFTVEFLPSKKMSEGEGKSKMIHYVAPVALAGGLLYLLKLVKNR